MEQVEVKRIIDQLERLYYRNWAEVNVQQILDSITDTQANLKLPGFKNSIHQIAQHLIADTFVVAQRLEGINYQLSEHDNWIPDDKIQGLNWQETKSRLLESPQLLLNKLQNLQDADLNREIIKDYSTVYVTLHGYIQHSYYHIGQISVIGKALV